VYYNWDTYSSFDLRPWTSYTAAYGTQWNNHGSTQSFLFDDTFHTAIADVFSYLNNVAFNYSTRAIDWIGCAGVGGCDNLPYHSTGRAFDITKVVFLDGSGIDTRGSWEVAETGNNRLYAALIASARIYFAGGGVLSAGWDASHNTHVHVDNWHGGSSPFNTGSSGDRVILRRINKVFGGSSLAVNQSTWTAADNAATASTLAAFGFASCYNIFGNTWHAIGLLDMVAKHGMANRAAGYYPPPGC
jgi:hypothetical protein